MLFASVYPVDNECQGVSSVQLSDGCNVQFIVLRIATLTSARYHQDQLLLDGDCIQKR